MKRIILLVLFIALLSISCNKIAYNKNVSVVKEELAISNDEAAGLIKETEALQASQGFPKLMYVTSKSGLRGRSEPSINGNIIGMRPYGNFFQVHGRQDNPVTIDGITDYWYRVGDPNDRGWLIITWYFGGYLSEESPADLPIVIGLWNFKEDRGSGAIDNRYMAFSNDFEFIVGHKETSSQQHGTWSINENGITLVLQIFANQEWPDLINPEFITVYTQINIIDRSNIELTFSQMVYGMTSARLVRDRYGYGW